MRSLLSAHRSSKVTRRFAVELSPAGCLAGALMVLTLPLRLLAAAVLAAAVHESFHILALMFCGNGVRNVRIGFGGAVIETEPLSPFRELVCAAAGPLGSFLCLLLVRAFPLVALCGLFQGTYNLLPIYPLDGGRIVRCICILRNPRRAVKISQAISIIAYSFVISIFMWLYIQYHHPYLLVFAGYFLYRTTLCRKTPCNKGGF